MSPVSTTQHIESLFFKHSIPLGGRKYVLDRIDHGPSRAVSNRYGNAMLKYVSKKAGSVMLESRRGEFPGAILMDEDSEVLTFFPQAPPIELQIRNLDGSLASCVQYRPDFIVVRHGNFIVREYRDEGSLVERMVRNPHQFYKDMAGRWHYRAAEEAFKVIGLEFEILSNQTLPAVLVNNTRFLEDYLSVDSPKIPDEVRLSMQTLIQSVRFLPFRNLLDEYAYSADNIFKAVVEGLFYVDLSKERLDVTDELSIFCDEPTYRAHKLLDISRLAPVLPVPGTAYIRPGTRLKYDGINATVVLSSERDVTLRDDDSGELMNRPLSAIREMHRNQMIDSNGIRSELDVKSIADISSDRLARALDRLDAVQTGQSDIFASRTISHFAGLVSTCQNDLEALMLLVDNQHEKGNRLAKLPDIVEELAAKAVEKYNTPDMLTKKSTYGHYIDLCEAYSTKEQVSLRPMSYVTFCKRCDAKESIRDRQGKRVQYQKGAIVQSLDDAYPVHGMRPHEVCYIDHTIAVIATVGPDGVDLGKPTLTIAVDGNTRQPRAMVLTYGAPSTWTVLLVLRDYVRRHERLPKIISIDNGKEFHSKELEFFCRLYSIDLRYRPPGMPRGGAMIERLIGATEEEVFAAMQGNTRQMRDPRLVTKSINPFNRAVWTLTAVYFAVEEYLFAIRPNRDHPALGMTPNLYEQQRLAETGARSHKLVRFDENIMLMTSPHAKRPFHKLCDRRGIWVGGQWYRHAAMDGVKKGTKLQVRVEPWLYNVIYVEVGGRWRAAIGNNPRAFAGRGRREVEIAFREQTRVSVVKANRGSVSPNALRKKGKLSNPENFDPRINAQQREMFYLFNHLSMTTALQLPTELLHKSETFPIAALDSPSPTTTEAASEHSKPAAKVEVVSVGTYQTGKRTSNGPTVQKLTLSNDGIYDGIPGYN